MVKLRAHFDGRVLVPEEPVDLPQGKTLEVWVEEVEGTGSQGNTNTGPTFTIHPVTGLAVVKVPEGTKRITDEDVRQAEDEW